MLLMSGTLPKNATQSVCNGTHYWYQYSKVPNSSALRLFIIYDLYLIDTKRIVKQKFLFSYYPNYIYKYLATT